MASRGNGALATYAAVDSGFEERRAVQRTVVCLRARLRLSNGVLLEAAAADISRTGIGFVSPRMIPIDQACRLFVDLSTDGTPMELSLPGTICHCVEQSPGRFHAGMRFLGLEPETAEFLKVLLD